MSEIPLGVHALTDELKRLREENERLRGDLNKQTQACLDALGALDQQLGDARRAVRVAEARVAELERERDEFLLLGDDAKETCAEMENSVVNENALRARLDALVRAAEEVARTWATGMGLRKAMDDLAKAADAAKKEE